MTTVPTQAEVEREIQDFVRANMLHEPYDGDDPLRDLTFDSLALEELIGHLEDEYLILFVAEDISRVQLASVPAAAGAVVRRATAVAAGDRSW